MNYSFNGQSGDNTRNVGKKEPVFSVGDWVIVKRSKEFNGFFEWVGYIEAVGEKRCGVVFVRAIKKTTREEFPICDVHGNVVTYQNKSVLKADMQHYELDRSVRRGLIHQMQLQALENNNKTLFYELGAMIDEEAN